MLIETFPSIAALSAQEKVQLASELWEDAMCGDLDDEDLKELLDRSMREYRENPENVISLAEVRLRFNMRKWRGKGSDLLDSGVDQAIEELRGR
jgi:putative addiction module component (TIGR02574 family)